MLLEIQAAVGGWELGKAGKQALSQIPIIVGIIYLQYRAE